ncbi:FAD-dependent monooxygenase [Nonomuraea sp. B5E05]|uniref:FAD-dependent monooxygenase n=1 Tax=Nonomuraea sp. B5E05 TaxID=3153569 RepID=UPI003261B2D0
MSRRILISGASIAGLTLAHWLSRRGFEPTVIERSPRLRAGGNGVDVRDQAIEVAERMGVMPRIRAAGADVVGMAFLDASGEPLARMDLRPRGDEVEIMRADLAAILHATAKRGVEYVFGDSIQSLRQDDDSVAVTFEQGSPRRFDLVVGADGIHSTVRRLAFGPETRFLRYLGHYFAFADADPALGENRWVTAYNEPGRMAGVYRSGNHTGAKANFMFHRREPLLYDHRDIDRHKDLLREAFTGLGWHVPALLDRALADPDLYVDSLAQVRMPSWSSGRIALVGDAAYCASPVSGCGARLAMVGAYRLAGELATADGYHEIAFRRYEDGFRDAVRRMQQVGPNLRLMIPKSRLGARIRNAIARSPLLDSLAGIERIMSPKNTDPLPDYDSRATTAR